MIEEKKPRPMEEPEAGTPQGGVPEGENPNAERYAPEHQPGKKKHFEVPNGVMNITHNVRMIAPKNAPKRKIPEDIKRDLPAYKKGEPQNAIFISNAGFFYGDGTPAKFSKSQLCDLIGLCKVFKMLLGKNAKLIEYKEGLGSDIWKSNHSFISDGNKIRMKLSDFSRIARGDKRGSQTLVKDDVHRNLLFLGTLYGRYVREIVKSKNLEEVYEPIIKYTYIRKAKYNAKTRKTTHPITEIIITFHDAFIYQGKGYASFPDNFADLVYDYGKDSIVFTHLLFDIIDIRGKRKGAFKDEAKVIEDGKGTKKEKGIAKGIKYNEEKQYKHTQKYLLDEVLGDDKERYYDENGFRTSDWKRDLREAIQAFVKMGLVDDVSRYGEKDGTYLDGGGGLGCDLRINLEW